MFRFIIHQNDLIPNEIKDIHVNVATDADGKWSHPEFWPLALIYSTNHVVCGYVKDNRCARVCLTVSQDPTYSLIIDALSA